MPTFNEIHPWMLGRQTNITEESAYETSRREYLERTQSDIAQRQYSRYIVDTLTQQLESSRRSPPTTWTDSRGGTTEISALQQNHLENILAKIIRDAPWREEYKEPIKKEILKRRKLLEKESKEMGNIAAKERVAKAVSESTVKVDPKIEKQLLEATQLLESFKVQTTKIYDLTVDGILALEEETMDDTFGLAVMKKEISSMIGQLNAWSEKQTEE